MINFGWDLVAKGENGTLNRTAEGKIALAGKLFRRHATCGLFFPRTTGKELAPFPGD